MRKKLSEMNTGTLGKVIDINGSQRFLSRITSIGLTPGSQIQVVNNRKKQPLLVYGRNTLIAVNRKESESIFIEEMLR